jgi:beta-lactamase regulating signal transducer with metallopeptidase domain
MTLAPFGWFVVHALWIGAALGGLTALALAVLPDHRARFRHALAYAALLLMVVLPVAATAVTLDLFSPRARRSVTAVVENAVGLPAIVEWRARVVRASAVIWILGGALFAVRIGYEWRRVRGLQTEDVAEGGPLLGELVSTLKSELKVQAPVGVRRSPRTEVPMVFGWRKSTILLPAAAARQLNPRQLRAVLAHELAHVRRRDYAANLLQIAVEAVLWFHPAARWVSRRIRAEREYCCDDVAVSVGTGAADYARALATLEDARHDCRLVVAAASGTLLDRIQRIVGQPRPRLTPARGALVLLVALCAASVIATLAMVVPPAMALDARLRSRSPSPPGAVHQRPEGVSLPRSPQR